MKKTRLTETTKIISKTKPNGETNFEAVESDIADKLNGSETIDSDGDKVKVKDTGKTINEETVEGDKLETQDLLNVGKALNSVVEDTLRQHGDNVAYTKVRSNVGRTHIIVYVYYEEDADNPGQPSEDRFDFIFNQGKVKLVNGDANHDICPIVKKTGTLYINRDLAKDALMKFLDTNDTVEGKSTENDYPNGQGFENTDIEAQDSYKTDDTTLSEELILGFKKAADAYKANPKDREVVKELLRQARNFEGDTIAQKLRTAVDQYKAANSPIEEPEEAEVVAVEEPIQQTCCNNGDLCMNMSLFLRLLEFAKEDAEEDVDIHYVAENLQNICNEKGCATMEDYDAITSKSETKPEGEDTEDMDEAACCTDLDETQQRYSDEVEDVLYRARNLDSMAGQDLRNAVMAELSEIFDVAESLDNSVEYYIEHTIPNVTLQGFKQAVDNALTKPKYY